MYRLGCETVTVFADWLVPSVTVPITKLEGGRSYMKVTKRDLKLHRLFLGGAEYGKTVKEYRDLMYATTVLDEIKSLKNAQWDALMPRPPRGNRRYGERESRARRLALPAALRIVTPTYGDVPGISMSVALTGPTRGLAVELKTRNLEYIRNAMLWQLAHRQESPRKRPRTSEMDCANDAPKGVHVLSANPRYKYCAVHEGEGGNRVRFYANSLDDAALFVLTGEKPNKLAAALDAGVAVEEDLICGVDAGGEVTDVDNCLRCFGECACREQRERPAEDDGDDQVKAGLDKYFFRGGVRVISLAVSDEERM